MVAGGPAIFADHGVVRYTVGVHEIVSHQVGDFIHMGVCQNFDEGVGGDG